MRPALVLVAALLVAGCGAVSAPAGGPPGVASSVAADELTLDIPELL